MCTVHLFMPFMLVNITYPKKPTNSLQLIKCNFCFIIGYGDAGTLECACPRDIQKVDEETDRSYITRIFVVLLAFVEKSATLFQFFRKAFASLKRVLFIEEMAVFWV